MATTAPPFLSLDDMLMGEILMSLKRDTPAPLLSLEPEPRQSSYRSKMTGLSVEVALPPSPSSSNANNSADIFSLDAFRAVSPLVSKLPVIPTPPFDFAVSPPSPARSVPSRGSTKRYGPVVQLADLRECFNMPIAAVARKFGICATLLKKICRRYGIQRWPHRQIRSLQKSIDMLHESVRVAKGTNKEYIAKKIAAFEHTLECIMQDPNTAAKGISAGRLASPATEEMSTRGSRACKPRKKLAAMSTPHASLSDDEEALEASGASSLPHDQSAISALGPSTERLTTRRASVPMSLQSILC